MIGWRARLGFLIPPGCPTVENETFSMAPRGVSVHFSRMVASGPAGSIEGRADRTVTMLDQIDLPVDLLKLVKPKVIVLAHTASSYALGQEKEAALTQRLQDRTGIAFTSAFASVILAFRELGVKSVALGTPYTEANTLLSKASLEGRGIEVVNHGRVLDCDNIYDETDEESAYALARSVDRPDADAVFLSGVGMPTVAVLEQLERDLRKPVVSSVSAMMWNALRMAGLEPVSPGFGSLLSGRPGPCAGR